MVDPSRASPLSGRDPHEYWDWLAVALFLLVSVDLLTSLAAVRRFGVAGEANPFMAWLLTTPLAVVVLAHLAVVVLAVVFFYGLLEMLAATPPPYDRYFALLVEVWLGGLVAAGLFVFANNLSVLVYGGSLLRI